MKPWIELGPEHTIGVSFPGSMSCLDLDGEGEEEEEAEWTEVRWPQSPKIQPSVTST